MARNEWLKIANYPDDIDNPIDTEDSDYNTNSQGSTLVRILQQVNEQKVSTQNVFNALPYRLLQIADVPITATPSINTKWSLAVKFDSATQKNFISLSELGSLITLTSGTYTASISTPSMLCNTTEGNITINLPAANTCKGVEFWFKKTTNLHSVIINGTIDGLSHHDINNQNGSIVIVSDGSVFWIKTHY